MWEETAAHFLGSGKVRVEPSGSPTRQGQPEPVSALPEIGDARDCPELFAKHDHTARPEDSLRPSLQGETTPRAQGGEQQEEQPAATSPSRYQRTPADHDDVTAAATLPYITIM